MEEVVAGGPGEVVRFDEQATDVRLAAGVHHEAVDVCVVLRQVSDVRRPDTKARAASTAAQATATRGLNLDASAENPTAASAHTKGRTGSTYRSSLWPTSE